MKLDEVCSITKSHGIDTAKLSKAELIESIQTGEDNFDCFATARSGECDRVSCLWREDCFNASSG